MPVGRKIGEALGEIGIVGSQRAFDFALDHRGIEFVPHCMVGNAAGIIEGVKHVRCARHDIGRSRSEQCHGDQGRPDPRYGRDALLR
jgi:hypothetical protein